MSHTCMDRRRRTGVLFQTLLLCWSLIGLCCAGHRPRERGERPRYTRHHDRWTQRIQYPSLHDQGTQQIEYPSLNDEGTQGVRNPSVHGSGQTVRYPSVNDSSAASSQIQKCAPGFYRDGSGLFLGRCVPCECNGLADECEDRTGRCLSCQYNTAGDRCERCKEGYYGNAAQGTCRVCPCPFPVPSNSFALGCKEFFGDFECICRAGYAGDKCESCAPGYYGDPLTPGGSCQPCNCNGNGNNCDPRTGVCKNTLEPGDTNTYEHCQECDNCAQTLLHDLETLDDEFGRIKTLLDNATAGASSQDGLKKLEKAVSDTKILVNKFSTTINKQKSRVTQLEDDVSTLTDDIGTLGAKADKRVTDADKAVVDVGNIHTRAEDLDSEIQNLLKKIKDLLDKLKADTRGDVSNENLAKMLEDAKRMVKKMEDRNFTPQKTAAEKERDEAKKLLDSIKNNVTKQCDENEDAAENLRSHLKGYEDKLKDLDKALKEAVDLLKKANTQNVLNAQTLGDLRKRIEDLKKERETVLDQLAMAENELKKTEDLKKMLSDSKTEFEQLAAQMDGAKTDLTKKVNDITKAAAKEGIVKAAEDHAKNLNKLAKDLEDTVKKASGTTGVRNVKDAVDVYKNITDAINAAEAAANKAKSAADNAFNNVKKQQLTQKAKDLKDSGNDLLKNAQEVETDLQEAAEDIADIKKRLKDADYKKKALQNDLLNAQKQLNDIKRGDIGNLINEAKDKAASANDTATNTMNKLNDIKKDMTKYNGTQVDTNLGPMMDDVDKTVKTLLETIPALNDKISEVENLTSPFSSISNISENIKKIKDLIEQARDAANRIVIPMKFTGNGHVEMRAPKNLEDLKAYTALSLALQRPEVRGDGRRRRRQTRNKTDMFVLYLGSRDPSKNYIGMFLKNNVLHGVYKLNGAEYEIPTEPIIMSVSEPAKFDKVDLHRIYQDVKISLSKDVTSGADIVPIEYKKQGDEKQNLLDLSPSDVVFYVGGYPNDFTPPNSLKVPKYKGCIEFFSFNDKAISLYNFQKAENINEVTPCKRYVPQLDSSYHEGTGYGKVKIDKITGTLTIKMAVFSRSKNGLLLYIGSEDNYFTVTMENGGVFLRSNLLSVPASNSLKPFPTSEWTEIFILSKKGAGTMTVRVGSKDETSAKATYENSGFNKLYIGGAPRELRERYNITIQPFKGCVKNLKLNSESKRAEEQVGISKGCPMDSLVSRKADFSLGSSLSSNLAGFSLANDVTVSLGFRSTENQGLILEDTQLANAIYLALENGHVILYFDNWLWKSNKQYHDGQWHYLTITKRTGSIAMLIDDEDLGQKQSDNTAIYGTGGSLSLGKDTFKGCISNLYTRRPTNLYKAEDFSTFQASGDVLLDSCTTDSLAQLMQDRASKKR